MVNSNSEESLWVWKTESGEYYYDKRETVRFRVEAEVWHDQSPGKPEKNKTNEEGQSVPSVQPSKVPYTVIVSLAYDGSS
jgi:DNA-directed RNA polymerase III subunit RPC8